MIKRIMVMSLAVMLLAGPKLAHAGNFFVIKHGKKIHKADCPLIKDRKVREVTKKEAEDKGLEPCSKCLRARALKAEKPKKAKQIKKAKVWKNELKELKKSKQTKSVELNKY